MAAILNSAILNLAILDSTILVFSLKLTHTCQDWFPPFAQKKPSLIHSDSTWWWQPSWILSCWIKKTSLIHSDSTWWWQSSWILLCWIQTPCFLLSDSLKNTLILLWLWLKLIQSDSNTFILTELDDCSHLEFHHLGFSHLSSPSQTHSQLPRLVPIICTKKPSLIHSDSTWWWQPSWILSCWIKKTSLIHSDSTWWWQSSWILPSWNQRFCKKLCLKLIQSDSLIHSDSNWWWQPSWILPSWICHLGFSHLNFSSQTHSHLPRLVPTICTKKNLHSFILTQLDDGSHLEFYQYWIQTLSSWIQTPSYLLSDSLKNILTPLWLWLKLIQSDSNLFILTQLIDGSHLEFGHHGFSHLNFSSQTHSHLQRLVPTICTKKTFTHSFWLNLMMAAILNSTMLDSDTAILDSDTFLSSLRLNQKHSTSTLTLDSN